jgi:hypothetical protein
MDSMNPLELARQQIEGARAYTMTLLDETPDDLWYQTPAGGKTHIAWQVGHIAFAEYGLCLVRVRGRGEDDDSFMPPTFRRRFSKKSDPAAITAADFPVEQVRQVFEDVHRQVLREIASFTPEQLQEDVPMPYLVFPNKLGALLLASHHEMLHAGQIGLTRRLLGLEPVR